MKKLLIVLCNFIFIFNSFANKSESESFNFNNTQLYSTKGENSSLPCEISLMIPKDWERLKGNNSRQILVLRKFDNKLKAENIINLSIAKLPKFPKHKSFEDTKQEFLSKGFAEDVASSDTEIPKILRYEILQKESPYKIHIKGQIVINSGLTGWHKNYIIFNKEYFILLKFSFFYRVENFSLDLVKESYEREKFFEQIYNSMKINSNLK